MRPTGEDVGVHGRGCWGPRARQSHRPYYRSIVVYQEKASHIGNYIEN